MFPEKTNNLPSYVPFPMAIVTAGELRVARVESHVSSVLFFTRTFRSKSNH